ncbi:FAD-dependent oxidoreductase [Kiloniella sp.]|uniref:FAD-dependent oxidoreductase n=1 Tax=Kiloniella sp. TaxID=1938587 RepID=UPI003B02325D
MHTDNLIIGGGISGLYLASKFADQEKDFLLVEARDRLGGRIDNHKGLDLGPTWFWPGQRRMTTLCKNLGISVFEQQNQGDMLYEDPNVQSERIPSQQYQMTSYRVDGGISQIIRGLEHKIPSAKFLLNHQVREIIRTEDGLTVNLNQTTNKSSVSAKRVFLALPPRLAARNMALLRFVE